VSGSPEDLYDYGISAHIQLTMNEPQFRGYDGRPQDDFSGYVTGKVVAIYDSGSLRQYNYIMNFRFVH